MFLVYSVTHVPGLYPALHSVGLLNVPYSTFAGADPQTGALPRGATHSDRRFRRFVTRTYAYSGLELQQLGVLENDGSEKVVSPHYFHWFTASLMVLASHSA